MAKETAVVNWSCPSEMLGDRSESEICVCTPVLSWLVFRTGLKGVGAGVDEVLLGLKELEPRANG
jgi:hypothetical protein